MALYSICILLIILSALAVALLVALSRHKKSGAREVNILGASALVESRLDPEGSVIIDGELWRARTIDGTSVEREAKVQVVELRGHLLIVKRES